ncbi:MAG: hypothetical protein WA151_24885 [Desulfatirhabdiaceae bacterium]
MKDLFHLVNQSYNFFEACSDILSNKIADIAFGLGDIHQSHEILHLYRGVDRMTQRLLLGPVQKCIRM